MNTNGPSSMSWGQLCSWRPLASAGSASVVLEAAKWALEKSERVGLARICKSGCRAVELATAAAAVALLVSAVYRFIYKNKEANLLEGSEELIQNLDKDEERALLDYSDNVNALVEEVRTALKGEEREKKEQAIKKWSEQRKNSLYLSYLIVMNQQIENIRARIAGDALAFTPFISAIVFARNQSLHMGVEKRIYKFDPGLACPEYVKFHQSMRGILSQLDIPKRRKEYEVDRRLLIELVESHPNNTTWPLNVRDKETGRQLSVGKDNVESVIQKREEELQRMGDFLHQVDHLSKLME